VSKRLAYFTGLDEAYIERSDLRVVVPRYLKELLRSTGVALGRMDARYSVDEVDDVADRTDGDPTEAAIQGPFDAVLRHYIGTDLGVSMPFTYRTRNQDVIRKWSYRTVPDGEFYEPSYVNVAPRLGRLMRRNPALRVFGASGYYDFATPFFDAELTFARDGIVRERVTLVHYESGHMLYVHEPTRQRLLADVRAFVRGDSKATATEKTSQINR
jgi:carboxypeptidase C (cathepsin A)